MGVRAKRKQTRAFQLESLEDRNLLSAIPSSVAAQIQPLKAPKAVTQTIKGLLTGTIQRGAGTHQVLLTAHGNLSVAGVTTPMTLSASYNLTEVGKSVSKWAISGGTATFTDSAGDQINVKFTGSGKGTFPFSFSTKGTVTGGSGHFKGATGTFSGPGTSEFTAVQLNVSLTVKTK